LLRVSHFSSAIFWGGLTKEMAALGLPRRQTYNSGSVADEAEVRRAVKEAPGLPNKPLICRIGDIHAPSNKAIHIQESNTSEYSSISNIK
jgi:hypothetical protein